MKRSLILFVLFMLVSVNITAAIYKGVAQKVAVYAYDPNTDYLVTGNEANMVGALSLDGQASGVLSDTNCAELGSSGVYFFNLTAAETDSNIIILLTTCSSANTYVDPVAIYPEQSLASYGVAKTSEVNAIGGNTDTILTASSTAAVYALLNSGLSFRGTVTDVNATDPNQFMVASLVGVGTGVFADVTAPYRIFVLRDDGGLGAAPQGETQNITKYDSATGAFTTNKFTTPVVAGDTIIAMHPRIAELALIKADTAAILVDTETTLPALMNDNNSTSTAEAFLDHLLVGHTLQGTVGQKIYHSGKGR